MAPSRLHFLPWFRTGLTTNISTPAVDGLAQQATATATVRVQLEADRVGVDTGLDPTLGPTLQRDVTLYGPGSVVGLDATNIVRRYPEPGARDPETNYFCLVEFRDADLPWRYTPAAPDAQGRLQPWLALVVVEDLPGRYTTASSGLDRIVVDESELPPHRDIWAWAHVQIADPADELSSDDVLQRWDRSPSALRARLLAPVRLRPDGRWRACLVPTFEAGRLAGLGEPGSAASQGAWTGGAGATGSVTLPVYDSWTFRTADAGDFESLVRRLTPRELPPTVGVRDLDISTPGSGLPDAPDTVVTFRGALVSPTSTASPWPAEHRDIVQQHLRALLQPSRQHEPDDGEYDPLRHDPVVGPSLYGASQARRERLWPAADDRHLRWMDELNLDPRARTVGGIGTAVVRMDQERLMGAAWQAAEGLTDVNRHLRAATLADRAGTSIGARLGGLPDEALVGFVGPSLARLRGDHGTALADLTNSDLPSVAGRSAFRRVVRARGPISQRLDVEPLTVAVTERLAARPDGPIGTYRRVAVPAGCDVAGLDHGIAPSEDDPLASIDPEIARTIDPRRRGELAPLRLPKGKERTDLPPYRAPDAGRTWTPIGTPTPDRIRLAPSAPRRHRRPLAPSVPAATRQLLASMRAHLDVTAPIAGRLRARITAPEHFWVDAVPSKMWATPNFPGPLYERVRELSVEYLVPGVGDIPDETVGLLETNDRYVESVMAGANHELSREFLWREYPAQLHGTWFRQFWNAPQPDIAPIGTWRPEVALGSQDGSAQADLVLVLKGTFPRRYPDVEVFAQRGMWRLGDDGDSWIRDLDPAGEVRRPVLAGELQPGVVFYGFDLTEQEARGDLIKQWGEGDPGWFFVLQEQPKGIRFGLDRVSRVQGAIVGRGALPGRAGSPSWDDVSWANVAAADAEDAPAYVDIVAAAAWLDVGPIAGAGGADRWGDDAAAMARITLQRPVQLKVHASAMLPDEGAR